MFKCTTSTVDDFINSNAQGINVIGTHSIDELVGVLKHPGWVMLMIKAGQPVNKVIDMFIPHLEPGISLLTAATRISTIRYAVPAM